MNSVTDYCKKCGTLLDQATMEYSQFLTGRNLCLRCVSIFFKIRGNGWIPETVTTVEWDDARNSLANMLEELRKPIPAKPQPTKPPKFFFWRNSAIKKRAE